MSRGMPVIGIVGGVGSGKSEVARALGRLGCVVADSDAMAKEILRRPAVRDEIVRWWGEGVLGADGEVDRAAVARIVFGDEAARRRLEGLVHPLIHEERARLIKEAERAGAPGFVIDAPLLYEAGVDRECDAVIFVEAPWDARAARVRASRGWDEQELRRRESAQMSVEEKRRRSDYIVDNTGGVAEIEAQARGILERMRGGAAGESRG